MNVPGNDQSGSISALFSFVGAAIRAVTHGPPAYYLWMTALAAIMGAGGYAYWHQFQYGLSVTGMNDVVSWGLYISNFTFLVGVAAAAVMLVLPTYVLKDVDFSKAVLIGEGLAVAALIMCLMFVTVDMGGPLRLWHMMPVAGIFNWPRSMLSWDVVVLNGYLILNVSIPFYILFCHYRGIEPNKKRYVPFVILSVFWAVGIHLVTGFLYAGLQARPFWNSSLLGPRFLASAFSAGPALMIIILMGIRRYTAYQVSDATVNKLAMIATVAGQVNLVMLGSELFKEFYLPTEHTHSAFYVFVGLEGHASLVPWVWSSIAMNVCAVIALMIHPIRRNLNVLPWLCGALFVAIWIEKGMGLIVPGFIPSPIGEVVDYTPSWVEIVITLAIWATGAFVFTALVRVAIPIELGTLRYKRPQSWEDEDRIPFVEQTGGVLGE